MFSATCSVLSKLGFGSARSDLNGAAAALSSLELLQQHLLCASRNATQVLLTGVEYFNLSSGNIIRASARDARVPRPCHRRRRRWWPGQPRRRNSHTQRQRLLPALRFCRGQLRRRHGNRHRPGTCVHQLALARRITLSKHWQLTVLARPRPQHCGSIKCTLTCEAVVVPVRKACANENGLAVFSSPCKNSIRFRGHGARDATTQSEAEDIVASEIRLLGAPAWGARPLPRDASRST